jgi:general secretion pathway protein M
MRRLTRLQSRIGALTVFISAASLLAWLIIYPLISEYRALGTSIEEKQFQAVQYQRLAANHDQLKSQLAQLRQRSRAKVFYVTGETPALASANMQQHLKRIIDGVGGELISTQLLPGDDSDKLSVAGLQVHLRADISTLVQILYRLENGQPMFFLNDVSINARPLRSAAGSKLSADTLDVHFSLTGYLEEAA